MIRGLGHLPDAPDARDWPVHRLLLRAGVGTLPREVDLSPHVDHVRDQTITSSCVGQAFARAVHVRAGVEGLGIPFPSALAIYALARAGDGDLLDVGCRPRDAAAAMATRGVCGEEHWPFDEGRVNDAVPWDVLGASADALVTGYYRITGSGADRCTAVRRALAAGFPVPFAAQVDEAFEQYRSGVIGALSGPVLGGHMTCLVGYRPGAFLGVNSWGPGWGDGGFYWISDERLGSDDCSDFYALTVAPRGEW